MNTMRTFQDFGLGLTPEAPAINKADSTELAVATYSNLGLVADEVKARESFGQAFVELTHEMKGQDVDLIIVPRLGELSLANLIERYDALTATKNNRASRVWCDLRDQYSPEELNQGQVYDIEAQAVLLDGSNDYDEAGLYFTSQSLEDQREAVRKAQFEHSSHTTALKTVSVASYLIRNAMQLERGEPLQDRETFTRFVELENKIAGGYSYVPNAASRDGRVNLDGSDGHAYSFAGVRLSVGLK